MMLTSQEVVGLTSQEVVVLEEPRSAEAKRVVDGRVERALNTKFGLTP